MFKKVLSLIAACAVSLLISCLSAPHIFQIFELNYYLGWLALCCAVFVGLILCAACSAVVSGGLS